MSPETDNLSGQNPAEVKMGRHMAAYEAARAERAKTPAQRVDGVLQSADAFLNSMDEVLGNLGSIALGPAYVALDS